MKLNLFLATVFLLAGYQANASPPSYPLFDGSCDEYDDLTVDQISLPNRITLWTFQDQSYVWLCFDLPPNSVGNLDLKIEAPNLEAVMNLHVSAAVGQWPFSEPESAPKTAESDKWWNHDGWFASPIYFKDAIPSDGPDKLSWHKTSGREFQISKNRFGRGVWKMQVELRNIADQTGELKTVKYPDKAGDHRYFEVIAR